MERKDRFIRYDTLRCDRQRWRTKDAQHKTFRNKGETDTQTHEDTRSHAHDAGAQ